MKLADLRFVGEAIVYYYVFGKFLSGMPLSVGI